jgi:hypothetical protein
MRRDVPTSNDLSRPSERSFSSRIIVASCRSITSRVCVSVSGGIGLHYLQGTGIADGAQRFAELVQLSSEAAVAVL